MSEKDEWCSEQVSTGGTFRTYQCSRKAVVHRKGKGYCRQHDPDEVEKRRKVRRDKWWRSAAERKKQRGEEEHREKRRDHCEKCHEALVEACSSAYTLIAGGHYHNSPVVNELKAALALAGKNLSRKGAG